MSKVRDIFARHIAVANNPALADARREWLKAHPAWMIRNGCVFYLLGSIGRECGALDGYPGPLWLQVGPGQADDAALERIAGLHGLEGLSLQAGGVGAAALGRLARAARGLRCLLLGDVDETTGAGLPRLAELPELEGLAIAFANPDVSSTGFLSELAGEQSPRSLAVPHLPLTPSDLANIARWTRLEACYISLEGNISDDCPRLSHLKNLRHLILGCYGPVTRSAMERIGELRELTKLMLSMGRDIDPEGLAFLADMEKLDTLAMEMHAETMPPDGGIAIANAIARSPSVRDLTIYGLPATAGNMAHLASMPRLENLCLDEEGLDKPDFAVMARAPRLKRLTFGELTSDWITHPTTDHDLAALAGIKGLVKWELRGDEYTARGLASLAALPDLKELSLEGLGSWDEDALSCLADFPSLTTLILKFDGRDKPLARRFSFLKGIRNLAALTVSIRNGWNESMLDDVSSVPGLKRFGFRNAPRLPGEWLAKLGRLPALEEFTLDDCPEWRDGNIRPLAGIGTLRRICISGCRGITAKGLLHLRDIPLETIDIDIGLGRRLDTGISLSRRWWPTGPGRALMALRRAWPGAEIR